MAELDASALLEVAGVAVELGSAEAGASDAEGDSDALSIGAAVVAALAEALEADVSSALDAQPTLVSARPMVLSK